MLLEKIIRLRAAERASRAYMLPPITALSSFVQICCLKLSRTNINTYNENMPPAGFEHKSDGFQSLMIQMLLKRV